MVYQITMVAIYLNTKNFKGKVPGITTIWDLDPHSNLQSDPQEGF